MNREKTILAIRDFNRFFTNSISVIDQNILQSGLSLAEGRTLFEIRKQQPCTARDVMNTINIDEGYLSRIINKSLTKKWITKNKSTNDKRNYELQLTATGDDKMNQLDEIANKSTSSLIEQLNDSEIETLLSNMNSIKELLA